MIGVLYGLQWGLNSYAEAEGRPPEGAPVTLGVTVSRRNRHTTRPELALSAGPVTLGQSGGGAYSALYGSAWAVTLGKAGARLWQAVGGVWRARTDTEATAAIPAGARHVALTFDQAARPVLAWEAGGAVSVRQWSGLAGEYVTRGPWPGRDPLLACDALAGVNLSDSDVLLFMLTDDALAVRVQRDLYAEPRALAALPPGSVLDQVAAVGSALYVLGEGEGGALSYLLSYPVHVRGDVRGSALGPDLGALVAVTLTAGGADALRGQISGPTGGALTSDLMLTAGGADALRGQMSGPTGGALTVALQTAGGADALRGQMSGPTGGAWANTTALHNDSQRINGAASGPAGGVYA